MEPQNHWVVEQTWSKPQVGDGQYAKNTHPTQPALVSGEALQTFSFWASVDRFVMSSP